MWDTHLVRGFPVPFSPYTKWSPVDISDFWNVLAGLKAAPCASYVLTHYMPLRTLEQCGGKLTDVQENMLVRKLKRAYVSGIYGFIPICLGHILDDMSGFIIACTCVCLYM